MAWVFEHTDTFGSDANYSWVNRSAPVLGDLTTLQIVRRAKALAGFTGLRCSVGNYSDSFTIRPIGRRVPCQVVFAEWRDDAEVQS